MIVSLTGLMSGDGFGQKLSFSLSLAARQLSRPDEVESFRHTGESRYPVSESNRRLDPGVRRGDEFKHQRAGSITTDYRRSAFLEAAIQKRKREP